MVVLSLDELMEREYERERDGDDSMTIGLCDQAYIAAVLDEVPDEADTVNGWDNEKPRDLVTLFRAA